MKNEIEIQETEIVETEIETVEQNTSLEVYKNPEDAGIKILGDEASELPAAQKSDIFKSFKDYFENAQTLGKKALSIEVKSEEETELMEEAKQLRKEIRTIRTSADKTKAALKRQSILTNRFLDGIYNGVLMLCEPAEKHLIAQEKYVELLEKARKDELEKERREKVLKLFSDMSAEQAEANIQYYNFREMPDENFDILLSNLKTNYDARIKKAEEEELKRLEEEKAEKERIRKIEEDNERLKAEQEKQREHQKIINERLRLLADLETFLNFEEAEKFSDAEFKKFLNERKQAYDLKIKEREEAAKKQREAEEEAARLKKIENDRIAAEQKKKEEAEAKKREMELAPDKEKLLKIAEQLQNFELPVLSCNEAQDIIENIRKLLGKVNTYIIQKVNEL